MFKGLTQRAQKVLTILAQEEAKRFHSDQLLPEHIILALLKDGEGVAVKALQRIKVSVSEMQGEIEKSLPKGKGGLILGDVPPSKRGQKILEDSAEEARNMGHEYIGTEHLLLGVLAQDTSMGAKMLEGAGVVLQLPGERTIRLRLVSPGNRVPQQHSAEGGGRRPAQAATPIEDDPAQAGGRFRRSGNVRRAG